METDDDWCVGHIFYDWKHLSRFSMFKREQLWRHWVRFLKWTAANTVLFFNFFLQSSVVATFQKSIIFLEIPAWSIRDFFLLLLIITQFPGWLSSPLPFNIYYSCLKCPIHRMCGGRYDEKSHYFIQTFFEALNFFQNPFTFPVVLPWSELMKACVSVEIARNSESSINYEERLNWPRENVVIWSYLWIFL